MTATELAEYQLRWNGSRHEQRLPFDKEILWQEYIVGLGYM
jgi:hypothetical protein